jgi:phage anti-repressor protein
MNDLVKVVENEGRQTVSARDLHKQLGVRRRFSTWIKGRIEKYGFVEGEDFLTALAGESKSCSPNLVSKTQEDKLDLPNRGDQVVDSKAWGGDRRSIDYLLSVGTAKEIAMVENNEKGREIRRYLVKVEEAWNSPEMVVQRAIPELLKMGRNGKNFCGKYSVSAGRAAAKMCKLQDKYRYTDKVEKSDVPALFECAVALTHYFHEAASVNDVLSIRSSALETKLHAMVKMLEENSRLALEGQSVPAIQSDEWLDKLYDFFRVEQRSEFRALRQNKLPEKQSSLLDFASVSQ